MDQEPDEEGLDPLVRAEVCGGLALGEARHARPLSDTPAWPCSRSELLREGKRMPERAFTRKLEATFEGGPLALIDARGDPRGKQYCRKRYCMSAGGR